MRTTLDLPKDLLEEAQRLAQTRTKTGAIILSLQKFIEVKKIEKLRTLQGKVPMDLDYKEKRNRRG